MPPCLRLGRQMSSSPSADSRLFLTGELRQMNWSCERRSVSVALDNPGERSITQARRLTR